MSLIYASYLLTVNRNLIGTGFMSTDQKKKLLWGSKKSTPTEEVGIY